MGILDLKHKLKHSLFIDVFIVIFGEYLIFLNQFLIFYHVRKLDTFTLTLITL